MFVFLSQQTQLYINFWTTFNDSVSHPNNLFWRQLESTRTLQIVQWCKRQWSGWLDVDVYLCLGRTCRRKVNGLAVPPTFLLMNHLPHRLWFWLWLRFWFWLCFWFCFWLWLWFRLYLWLCFYLGLRLRGYFYFYYLLLVYGHASCTKPPCVLEKAVNEDHRHDRAIRNQK